MMKNVSSSQRLHRLVELSLAFMRLKIDQFIANSHHEMQQ